MITAARVERRSAIFSVQKSVIEKHGGKDAFISKHLAGQIPKNDVIEFTVDGKPMLSGDFLFELKATHGFPLELALDRIREIGAAINWPDFIECARENGWWDFQTYDCIKHAMQDAEWPKDMQQAIMEGFILYVTKNKHPRSSLLSQT